MPRRHCISCTTQPVFHNAPQCWTLLNFLKCIPAVVPYTYSLSQGLLILPLGLLIPARELSLNFLGNSVKWVAYQISTTHCLAMQTDGAAVNNSCASFQTW